MDPEREAFLKAITNEPVNYLHRWVYADWLDERGDHEEATRQRAFERADQWLRAFAERVELTYEDVIGAGHGYAERKEYFRQEGGMEAQEAMFHDDTREQFWTNWSIVTGTPITRAIREGLVFSCSC